MTTTMGILMLATMLNKSNDCQQQNKHGSHKSRSLFCGGLGLLFERRLEMSRFKKV